MKITYLKKYIYMFRVNAQQKHGKPKVKKKERLTKRKQTAIEF